MGRKASSSKRCQRGDVRFFLLDFFLSPLPYLIHEISFVFNSRMPAKCRCVSLLPPTMWWLGSPSDYSCIFVTLFFLSTWAQMRNQKFHPILQVLLSIQMFLPPWRNPSFLHGVFSIRFHFSFHGTVPGHGQGLCWFFRKDVKASGRHRQLLGHSGWFLKHQDSN